MTLAPATALRPAPATRLAQVPNLNSDERRRLLEALASDVVTGTPPDDAIITILVAALAFPDLRRDQAIARWQDYKGEYERWADREAGQPVPGFFEDDLRAALDDLADGTSRYRGERR